MKKSTLSRLLGITFLIMTFLISACTHSSAKTCKQPPGICTVYSHDLSSDLQSASDFSMGYFAFGVLPDPQWEPKTTLVGVIYTRAGKALPKTARQRLYGLGNMHYSNQKLC